jgi:site-specific recombinase XerD
MGKVATVGRKLSAVKRTNPFPYCYRDKGRQGRTRWLLRLPGQKSKTIKATYGTPEFAAAYRAALERCEDAPKVGLGRTVPGTFEALAISYLNSPAFKTGKAPETQRSERGIINNLVANYGKCVWCDLRQEHVQKIVDAKANKPSAARNRLAVLRTLGEHAIAEKWRKDNPAIGVKRPKIKGKGFRPWSDDHCANFESTHPVGTRARLAYELLSCTALRRSDIVRVGRQHVKPLKERIFVGPLKVTHEIDMGQEKTDEDVGGLLILPQLQAAIDAMPSDNMTFVVTKGGRPLTKESFGNWFHDCCVEAGLTADVVDATGKPKGLASHGLRKRMAHVLADLGCGDEWIAAVLGHKDTRQVKVYTKGANKKRMARSALLTRLKAEQTRTSFLHTPGEILHTAPQAFEKKRV